jgi:hypothetical protein
MVYAFDKSTGTFMRPQTARKFWLPDFYTTDLGAGPTDIFERILSDFDGRAAPILETLAAAQGSQFRISPEDRLNLAIYLGLLNVRVTTHRDSYQRKIDNLGTSAAAVYADEIARSAPNAKRRKKARKVARFLAEGSVRIKAPDAGIVALRAGFPMGAFLHEMHWAVLDRSHAPYFVLGDNPASVVAPSGAANILDPRVEVAVPISAHRTLVMNWHATDGVIYSANVPSAVFVAQGSREDAVLYYGVQQWRTAGRFIFAASETDLRTLGDVIGDASRTEVIQSELVPHGRLDESGEWIQVDKFPDPNDYRNLIRRRR